jgi:pimeloyl-ACP methyl ester carboxylesterase
MMWTRGCAAAAGFALSLTAIWHSCATAEGKDMDRATISTWVDTSPHKSAYVEANGIRLNYLDWGGSGPPLVMVHGLANSPHIFDDLAPLLSKDFRVVAYARRGHGHSDAPDGPYDSVTLTQDLRGFLDALGIEQASLLGWSMGGDEITAFAGLYPERVERVIYLEGGYDWSDPGFFKAFADMLVVNGPSPATLRSLGDLRDWFHAAWIDRNVPWTQALEAFLRDSVRIQADGTVQPVPSEKVFPALLQTLGSWRRDYTRVRAPALVLYAPQFFPTDRKDAALAQKLRDFEQNSVVPFRQASVQRIRRELSSVTIRLIPGRNHMSIGVIDPEDLAATLREFLLAGEATYR